MADKKGISTAKGFNADYEARLKSLESRVAALGYKEGVAEISGGLTINGTGAKNILKKQGKYVIFNLDTGLTGVWSGDATITVPQEFIPKSTAHFYVRYGVYTVNGIVDRVLSTYVDIGSGKIHLDYPSDDAPMGVTIKNVGWETK